MATAEFSKFAGILSAGQYSAIQYSVGCMSYRLKPGKLISPVSFFFLKIALAIQGLLCFCMNCEHFCYSSMKMPLVI